jgi:hypothetical protein
VLEQERHRVRVAEWIVDRDELDVGLAPSRQDRSVEGPADSPESVDADTHGHEVSFTSCPDG